MSCVCVIMVWINLYYTYACFCLSDLLVEQPSLAVGDQSALEPGRASLVEQSTMGEVSTADDTLMQSNAPMTRSRLQEAPQAEAAYDDDDDDDNYDNDDAIFNEELPSPDEPDDEDEDEPQVSVIGSW